jgi:hypothetical protein
MEGGTAGHNIEKGPPKDHPSQISFILVHRFQSRRFKCDFLSKYKKKCMPNLDIQYKSAERKISQKKTWNIC